jgi:hypothetical protein
MKICSRCVLPETYPGIRYDEKGICNFCHRYDTREKENREAKKDFAHEEELKNSLKKYIRQENKYDVLVPISGGVDSCFTLIRMVETFKLRPLVFHSDHGWDDKEATANAEKLCKHLDVDLIIWKNELKFMRRLFKIFLESKEPFISPCFPCGNMLYLNGLELADNFKIPLVVNGYSKGQAAMMQDKGKAVDWYTKMNEIVLESGDMEFFAQFNRKWAMLKKQVIYQGRADLERELEPGKILFIPLFVFKFYQTDKEMLQRICRERFDWKPLALSFPARTTNCEMIWLNSYRDMKIRSYTHYHDEYSTLIRAGEISRAQALRDLELHPPAGLLERLCADVQVDLSQLEAVKPRSREAEKTLLEAKSTLARDDVDEFQF